MWTSLGKLALNRICGGDLLFPNILSSLHVYDKTVLLENILNFQLLEMVFSVCHTYNVLR